MSDSHRTTEKPFLRLLMLILISVLLSAAILGGFLLYRHYSRPAENGIPLPVWSFASGTAPRANGIPETMWKQSDEEHPIAPAGSDTYVYIRGTLPAAAHGYIHLSAPNAVYQIAVDRKTVRDDLQHGISVSPAAFSVFPVEATLEDKEIEIIAYVPFAREIFLSLHQENGEENVKAPRLLSTILCLLGLLSFLILHISRTGFVKVGIYNSIPVTCFLSAAIVLLGQYEAPTIFFELQIACVFIIYWLYELCANYYMIKASGRTNKFENLFAVNLLYCVALFLPYKMFMVSILRLGILLQVFNTFMLLIRFVRMRSYVRSNLMSVMLVMTVTNTWFWYMAASGNLENAFPAFVCTVAVCSIYSTALVLVWRKGLRYGASHRAHHAELRQSKEPKPPEEPVQEKTQIQSREPDQEPLVYTSIDSCPRARSAMDALMWEKGIGLNRHALHVAEYTRILCFSMGMSHSKASLIADAAVLHDVGKVCIPLDLLQKSSLTDEEFAEIRKHNIYGYQILSGTGDSFLSLAAQIAREHHEFVDGSGYLGLKQNEISLPARIVTVADVFDALTVYRAYKKTWNFDEAMSYIIDNSGIYFDQDVVKAFQNAEASVRNAYNIFKTQESADAEYLTERSDAQWTS